ncbi:MAG TPA: hypothetical protein VH540_14025 [Ktedonobacterales bacterium]|jgi:hypothetical protein
MHPQERLIRQLFTTQQCSHCATPYQEERVVVLARRGGVWMILASCTTCERKGIFVVSFPGSLEKDQPSILINAETLGEGALTQAVLADDPPGSAEAPTPSPVTCDDVIDMHVFLRHFDGNFAALFASPPGGERFVE